MSCLKRRLFTAVKQFGFGGVFFCLFVCLVFIVLSELGWFVLFGLGFFLLIVTRRLRTSISGIKKT